MLAQENYFFDGVNDELKKQQTLRVRFYNTDQKAVITIKVTWKALPESWLIRGLSSSWIKGTSSIVMCSPTLQGRKARVGDWGHAFEERFVIL